MNVRSLTRATTLRSAIISGGLLWAVGALALGAVGFLEVEDFWVGVICLLAFGLMLGGALRVAASLLPLARLGQRLAPVRDGSAARLEGEYPAEVHPLVDEVNDLLRRNQEALRRSHLEADSLAHGLKTPLTILTNEIERLRKDDHPAAEGLREQVEAMSDRVTLHLSRASAAAARLAHPPPPPHRVLPRRSERRWAGACDAPAARRPPARDSLRGPSGPELSWQSGRSRGDAWQRARERLQVVSR